MNRETIIKTLQESPIYMFYPPSAEEIEVEVKYIMEKVSSKEKEEKDGSN